MKNNSIRKITKKSALFNFEEKAWKQSKIVCGVDEVGRGCLAGPIVTTALILNTNSFHPDLKDSKLLSQLQLKKIYKWIIENSTYSIGISNNRIIDRNNIYQTTKKTMKKALFGLLQQKKVDLILIDAMPIELQNSPYNSIPIESWIKGESKSATIAAASIVAKVTRDIILTNMSTSFPIYNLEKHKGYGTKAHQEAIIQNKASIIHRQTFLKKIKERPIDEQKQQSLFC